MVGGIIKKGADIIKKSKNIIKMTPEEIARRKKNLEEVNMNLLKDLWGHLKEWNEWKMKDWIKAGIVVVIVLVVLKIIIVPGA
jgi:flagellar biosynthesis/type III secretory pathway M-ring protein FliF/YscJ